MLTEMREVEVSPAVGVLFMQSQEFFGADSQIHASIMRHLDRDRFEVHCAVPRQRRHAPAAPSTEAVRHIPYVHVRPTEFGPTLDGTSRRSLLRDVTRSGLPAVFSLLGLAMYARKHRIAIVHCTEKPRDVIYGTLVARWCGAQCVVHVHVKAETWIRAAVRRRMHRAAALIGISDFVAGSIRDLGYDASKVVTVLNGLEVERWIGAEPDGDAIRRELAIVSSTPLILSASRLYRYKGQHELLTALPIVKREFPEVILLIVGEDDPRADRDVPSYTAELKKLCDDLDLRDNVSFTGFRADVRSIMAASDVFAMPSFEEPFGMVFLEAMALGKPVIALDNGGTREVVDNGGSGLLSAPADTEQLARNIIRLLRDPELRRRMGEHGQCRVIERFNSVRMTRDVERVYDMVRRSLG